MLRVLMVMGFFVAAVGVGSHRAAAEQFEGPWCAQAWLGSGGDIRDCHFRTFEECWPNVISGNRGFCNQNPRWAGWNAPVEPVRHHGKRHAKRG
jgi:hypothetical protein